MILEVKLNWQEKATLLRSHGSVGNHLSNERPVVLDNGRSDDKAWQAETMKWIYRDRNKRPATAQTAF